MKYYLDYLNTNNLGGVEYAPGTPEKSTSFFSPNLALVIFENCFVHDKWNKWQLAGELKSRHGRGCAINTLRFLNLISEETQTDLIHKTTPISFTPFDEIIRLTADSARTPMVRRPSSIIERQFDISTAAQTDAFFNKLNTAMPANTCVIIRMNSPPFEYHGAKSPEPVILHPGHVAIISKDTRGVMYYADVLYDQILPFDIQLFIDSTRRYTSISLMFEVVVPGAHGGRHRRRTRRLRRRHTRKRHSRK